jgi:hypothetical protein
MLGCQPQAGVRAAYPIQAAEFCIGLQAVHQGLSGTFSLEELPLVEGRVIGGPLSHGTIVAREHGIPAVLVTGAATARIHHGQTITVDGDKGVVSWAADGNG